MTLNRARNALLAVMVLVSPGASFGAVMGTLEKTFNFHVGDIVVNPAQPYVYATIPSTNSLAVINTNTLTLAATVPLGVTPNGITVSPDGSAVYVSNSGTSIQVLNTTTNQLAAPIPIGHSAYSVAVGSNNRIWVIDGNGIQQFNAATGASTGPNAGASTYSGRILTSPDGNSLYYATYGLSPGSLYKFDVSGTGTPTKLYQNPTDIGENGEDLVLSKDGSRLAYVCGYGNKGYQIPGFRTSDMTIIANYATGAYPDALAYSPDSKTIYALHTIYPTAIDVDSTDTGANIAHFAAADRGFLESVDNSGQNLFVAYDGTYYDDATLKVYAVPEPATLAIMTVVIGLLIRNRPDKD